jgi:hypothetical protein
MQQNKCRALAPEARPPPFAISDRNSGFYGVVVGVEAGDVLAADGTQQFHTLAGEDAGEGVPAFKGQMAFVKSLSTLGAMPGVDEFA